MSGPARGAGRPAAGPRFDRLARLVGPAAMERLAAAHVVVFGLGGVGSFAAEALARSGLGRLTLVDGDPVDATNFNRQLHAVEGALGRPKADAMAERLRRVSPAARIGACAEPFRGPHAARLCPPGVSFVVDAIDHVTDKLDLLCHCVRAGIPIVSSMGAAGRLDPTLIRVSDLAESMTDPFARAVRKYLRKRHGLRFRGPTGIVAVWSLEPARLPLALPGDEHGIPGVKPTPPPAPGRTRRRAPMGHGSAVFVTGAFGLAAAGVVVRTLAGAAPSSRAGCI